MGGSDHAQVDAALPGLLYVDNTGRLAGTMYVSEMLAHRPPAVALDEWITGEAWRNEPRSACS